MPDALKEAGYRTAIVGKWHLGHADRKYWPRQRGFDYRYGLIARAIHGAVQLHDALTRVDIDLRQGP